MFEILFSKPDFYRLVTMRKFGSSSRAILLIETFMGLSSTPLAEPRTLSAIANWLAAFKASAEIECAELVLVGLDRPITTTYGDQGDHGWCPTQDRSHGRLGRHQGTSVDAIGPAGGVDPAVR